MFHSRETIMNISDYLSKQLQPGEEVIRIVRRHKITMSSGVGLGSVLILTDFFLIAWWFQHRSWGGLAFTLMAMLAIWIIIRSVYLWQHNVLAITNRRIIDIDQRGWFERNVAEAPIEKIQDVRYTIRGLWPTIFRFGTIVIQTAGSETNLELEAVQHPVELQQLILDLQRHVQHSASGDLTGAELVEMIKRVNAALGPGGQLAQRPIRQPHED